MISQQKLMQLEENLKEIESKLFPQKSFNVFDVLKISSYEIRHSNVLAWLFDGKASHQLKYSFLQTFISTIKQNSANNQGRLLIDDSVEVYREFYNIDIVVCSSKQKWVIAIENKINHHETEFQLQNYGSVISEYFKDYDQHYFLLSKNGIISSYPELWKSIGYEEILNILDEITSKFSEKTNSQILEFIDQYKTIIRRDIVKDDKSTRELIEFYYRNKSILDKIYEVIPTESKQYKELIIEVLSNMEDIIIDASSNSLICFTTNKLDNLIPKSSTGWTKSKRLMLFEIENRNEDLVLK